MAAGRLVTGKAFDVLIRAFAGVVECWPEWQLRIYGVGPADESLRVLIRELALENSVFLMGRANDMEAEWVKASIGVSASRHEGFGLTLLEGMRAGLTGYVSTDCDFGPREIINDGVDGVLVPVDDTPSMTKALSALIEDRPLRLRLGTAGRESAQEVQRALQTAQRYEQLFERLRCARTLQPRGNVVLAQDGRLSVSIDAASAPGKQLALSIQRAGGDGASALRVP